MRQAHAGGDKLFVDYAGDTAPVVIDRLTGEIREAQIFVAVLDASNFAYAEATWTHGLADWIGAHSRTLDLAELAGSSMRRYACSANGSRRTKRRCPPMPGSLPAATPRSLTKA